MSQFNLFAQMTKVDEEKRLVIGRAVQEVPDRSGEIFDYASSKPHFEQWSKSFADDTDGKSLGNLRAMHGKVAAGKLTGIDFNDADKAKVNQAYAKVAETWVNEQEAAGRPGKAMVADIRALRARYEAMTPDQRMQKVLQAPVPGLMPLK